MEPQTKHSSNNSFDWVPVMLGGIIIPAALAIALLAINKPEAAAEIGILLGVFAGMMALAAYTTMTARATATQELGDPTPIGEEGKLSVEAAAAAAITEGINWVDTVPATPSNSALKSPFKLQVTNVYGACAHGFLPGNTWVLDTQGNLSRPICAAAAKAFKAMYRASGKNMPKEIACDCPLADRKVVFGLEAMT